MFYIYGFDFVFVSAASVRLVSLYVCVVRVSVCLRALSACLFVCVCVHVVLTQRRTWCRAEGEWVG